MADPFSLVSLDNQRPIYLPSSYVQARQAELETLQKARRQAGGRLFQDWATNTTASPGRSLQKRHGLPFGTLRTLADTSPIDALIIQARMLQMRHVARRSLGPEQPGFAVRHVRDGDPGFETPAGLQKLAREIEEFLTHPTAAFHATQRDFLTIAVEEELTIDRKAMVISRGVGRKPVSFHLLDGATILPVPVVMFQELQKQYTNDGNESILGLGAMDAVRQRMSQQIGTSIDHMAYVQVLDGQIVGAWRDDEMSVDITNPSVRLNTWGYGRSLLERSWRLSQAFLDAWTYNTSLFEHNYPEAILGVSGEYSEDGLKAFKRKMLGEDATGPGKNWRLPILDLGDDPQNGMALQMFKLRDTPRDMLFMEFLTFVAKLKCAAYRIHPGVINIASDGSGGINLSSGASEEQLIAAAQEEGFHALLESIGDWLTRTIVQAFHKDLRLVWIGLNKESDDAKIERAAKKVQSFATINEVRQELGMPPLPEGMPENPGDFIGSYQQALGMLLGQQQQQQQDQYDQGDFGDEDGDEGDQEDDQQADQRDKDGDEPQQEQPTQPEQPARGGPTELAQDAQRLQRSRRFSIVIEDDHA